MLPQTFARWINDITVATVVVKSVLVGVFSIAVAAPTLRSVFDGTHMSCVCLDSLKANIAFIAIEVTSESIMALKIGLVTLCVALFTFGVHFLFMIRESDMIL
jgi:hypothetical protein